MRGYYLYRLQKDERDIHYLFETSRKSARERVYQNSNMSIDCYETSLKHAHEEKRLLMGYGIHFINL